MVDFNNAAGRLYTLLNELRSKNKAMTIQHAFAEMFDVDKKDIEKLVALKTEIIQLTADAKQLILKQTVDHDLYLKPFIKIQRVFALGLDHPIQNIIELLDDSTMARLEHCAELLSRNVKESQIEDTVLQQLLNNIIDLEKSVAKSTLSDELKSLILDNLFEIKKSIDYYQIHGTQGIEKAVKNTFGSVQYFTINNPIINISNEADKKVIFDYTEFIANIITIVSAGLNAPLLVEKITGFLLGSGK